ncbi:hypothetical protein P12x_005975 (plasmid) [Tundrisphaera lichenicola]|uniref:hypothetical protein n=1 Tax=Tundrisphaera lichenicola TaxID=2029860 RepID=UPI003EB9641F
MTRRACGEATIDGTGWALHSVSVWAGEYSLSPGVFTYAEESNEIAMSYDVLKLMDVAGGVVMMDEIGSQKEIGVADALLVAAVTNIGVSLIHWHHFDSGHLALGQFGRPGFLKRYHRMAQSMTSVGCVDSMHHHGDRKVYISTSNAIEQRPFRATCCTSMEPFSEGIDGF